MTLIYDKEKAAQKKQEIDASAIENPALKIYYCTLRFVLISIFVCGCIALFIWGPSYSDADSFSRKISVVCMNMLIPVFCSGGIIYTLSCVRIKTAEELYPPIVKYHLLATEPDKTILKQNVYCSYSGPGSNRLWDEITIEMDIADNNAVVTSYRISFFPDNGGRRFNTQWRTDISEEVFDADTQTIYRPYNKKA